MNLATYIIVMTVLVIFSAYFSATETAFSCLNKTRLKAMAEKGQKKAALAVSLSEQYDKLLSTILIGNNIVNIALASIGTMLFIQLIEDADLAATVSTGVVTVVVLIFGEISPKSIAKDYPERFAMFSAPFIRLLIWAFSPLNFLFGLWKKLLSRLFRVEDNEKMSQEELLMLVEEVEQEGAIDTDEGDLIRSAIEFTGQKAEDILTHRVDLVGVSLEDSKEEIAKVFYESRFSRLPVHGQSMDDIVGIIHVKDFFTQEGITKKPLEELMTEPLYIQKSIMIDDLLKEFQKNKTHLAVVVDDYGGTVGIVTMEDIFEELVGEIWDEHDEVVEEFHQMDDHTYLVDCSVDFEDFSEFFAIEDQTDNRSVGGWVMEKLDKIPE
ncbi:MAG: HlyC/CorC family transporter, partial [Clostridia bacterium]|nr:HlyC/CorC family transporter [Clostridia bacterium]